jgi:hypothetical protein
MRSLPQIAVLAAAIALLPACGKNEETPAAKANTSAAAQQQAADPFQRNGELLSINVDTMPRAAFVAKLSELTGAKITVEGDNNQTVTLHIADGSLRKVLSMAMADVPYTISMQFANLQDSFPISVSVTRYHAANATQPQPVAGNAPQASLAAMLHARCCKRSRLPAAMTMSRSCKACHPTSSSNIFWRRMQTANQVHYF